MNTNATATSTSKVAITSVFPKCGVRKSIADTMTELTDYYKKLNPDDKFTKQKSAGSTGGAIHGGYIKAEDGFFECISDSD